MSTVPALVVVALWIVALLLRSSNRVQEHLWRVRLVTLTGREGFRLELLRPGSVTPSTTTDSRATRQRQ